MRVEDLLARIDEAAAGGSERRHGRSECPDCGDDGPHESNGMVGPDEAFACAACGAHFDAEVWS